MVFVDTNVLIYLTIQGAPEQAAARSRLTELREARERLWISRQVVREFLAVLTRPSTFGAPASVEALENRVSGFQRAFRIADEDAAVTASLLALLREVPCGGKQVHDANLVATMLVHGIDRLLTHNTEDFRRFEPWIEVLPLVAEVGS